MTCTRPIWLGKEEMLVPCGKCIACKIQRVSEWSMRVVHEMEFHDTSMFLTLSYADEFLPSDESLDKEHIQLFYKRLRRLIEPMRIKMITAGEYGEERNRPHYHAIIFGLGMEDHRYEIRYRNGKKYYPILDGPVVKAWGKGFATGGFVSYNSARYTLEYMQKGQGADSAIGDRADPFITYSKGIGKQYVIKNKDRLEKELNIKLFGVERGLPKYYRRVGFNYRDQFNEKFLEIDPLELHKLSKEKNEEMNEFYRKRFGEEKQRTEWIKHCFQKEKNLVAKKRRRRGLV